ncbi:MAG TPA: S8 family serine peptidase [Terriglobia bacterium]|nr:S8 family serine peptidase [Terriglobia bacterium]
MKRRPSSAAAGLLLLSVLAVLSPTLTYAAAPERNPKLATPLASLAASIPQVRGPLAVRARLSPPLGFSIETMPKTARDAVEARHMRINSSGEVQVYVQVAAATEKSLQQLRAASATIEISDQAHRLLQARVPVARLDELAALPFVQFVSLPNYGRVHTGAVESQGDAILKATLVRSMFHVDGTGVRVGAISDGLKGIFATGCTTCSGVAGGPISTGDLPGATGTRNASGTLTSASGGITAQSFSANHDLEGLPPAGCGFPGAGAEGTALLEIVHDLAPGAQLFFANFDTSMAFEQAVNYIAANADVGADDIGFFGLPYDGTSAVSANTASALNNNSNPLHAWLTAVGNEAEAHYAGLYVDSKIDGAAMVGASGDLHLFQPSAGTTDVLGLGSTVTDKILLPPQGEAAIILNWNDSFGSSTNDYDLYLVDESTGKVAASSVGKSCEGTANPVACLDYTNSTGAQSFFDIVIQNPKNQSAPKTLDLFVFTPECAQAALRPLAPPSFQRQNYDTATGSVAAEGDAGGSPASVISVGAICSAATVAATAFPGDASCLDSTNSTIEFYSSIGPTADGRVKPDVSAIDGVSVTGAGSFENPFFGSSAAAPHAAGVDALLLQLAPCLRAGSSGAVDAVTARTTLHGLLLNNADPLGSPIPNNTFGAGRIDALTAALKTIPTANGVATETASGNTPTGASVALAGLAFSDPHSCPLTYNFSGACGSGSGASINCPFGTSAVTLTASNNGVTLTASAKVTITVTNFALSATPATASVSPGQSATYTVTVTPKIGAFPSAITLGCSGLPSRATCSFSPATVTPGASAVTSQLTLSTAAAGAFAAFRPPAWLGLVLALLGIFVGLAGFGIRGSGFGKGKFLLDEIRNPKSETWFGPLLFGATLAALLLYVACGGGSSTSPPVSNPGTPAGTYNVTVMGTAGSLVQSAPVTLTVQ